MRDCAVMAVSHWRKWDFKNSSVCWPGAWCALWCMRLFLHYLGQILCDPQRLESQSIEFADLMPPTLEVPKCHLVLELVFFKTTGDLKVVYKNEALKTVSLLFTISTISMVKCLCLRSSFHATSSPSCFFDWSKSVCCFLSLAPNALIKFSSVFVWHFP